jgi:hypothetical protein
MWCQRGTSRQRLGSSATSNRVQRSGPPCPPAYPSRTARRPRHPPRAYGGDPIAAGRRSAGCGRDRSEALLGKDCGNGTGAPAFRVAA